MTPAQSPPPELRERILDAVQRERAPTRRDLVKQTRSATALLVLALLAVSLSHGARPLLSRPLPYLVAISCAFLLASWVPLALLSAFARSALGPSRPRRGPASVLALMLLPSGALIANLIAPSTWVAPDPNLLMHVPCTLLELGAGALGALVCARVLVGADPVAPRATARLALSGTAGLSALAVTLQCHFADPVHTLATHVLPAFAVVFVFTRWLARRVAPR